MALKLVSPVRRWEARRGLRAARRRADDELIGVRLPSPRLAWRVQEIVADAHRIELARSLTDVVRAADERLLPSASPLDRAAIRECRAPLLELAARLCDLDEPVSARGVLIVEHLLVDAAGPLYGSGDPTRLRRAVSVARGALDGPGH